MSAEPAVKPSFDIGRLSIASRAPAAPSAWPVGALVEDSGGAAVAERLAHGGGFREVAGRRRGAVRVAVVDRAAQVLRRRAHAAHGAFAGRHDHVGAAGGHGVADERGNIRSKVPSRSR